jgi:hypothetical protein
VITKNRLYTNEIWKVASTSKKTQVVAATSGYTFSGYLNHAANERVLDILNQGSVMGPESLPEDFLQLTEVEIISADGLKKQVSPSCLIAKPNILFVAEKNVKQENPRLAARLHPLYQPKKSVCVEILMPNIAMLGNVHVSEWQRPLSVINTMQRFLPLTMISLSSRLNTGDVEFDFAAVNRNEILFMAETEAC